MFSETEIFAYLSKYVVLTKYSKLHEKCKSRPNMRKELIIKQPDVIAKI